MDIETTLSLAIAAHRLGDSSQALSLYEQVLAQDPHQVEALQLSAVVLRQTGDLSAAEQRLRQAVTLDPEHGPAWRNLALLQSSQRNLVEALHSATMLCKILGDRADSWRLFGQVAVAAERLEEAELGFEKALVLAPTDPVATLALIELRWRVGRAEQAECQARTAYEQGIGQPFVATWIGKLRDAAGDKTAAEQWWRTAVMHEPACPEAAFLLGARYRDSGRFAEAVFIYERGLQSRALPELWIGLGNARMALGEVTAAEADWKQALALRPQDVVALHNLGASEVRRGDLAGIEHLGAAVDISEETWPVFAWIDAISIHDAVTPLARWFRVLEKPDIDAQPLERPLRRALSHLPEIATWLKDPDGCSDELRLQVLQQPLLHLLLTHTLVSHPVWEDALRTLRLDLLRRVVRGEGTAYLPALEAFARHGFHAEYAWARREEERVIVVMLEALLVDHLETDVGAEVRAAELLALGMYGPLNEIDGIHKILADRQQSSMLNRILDEQVLQPLEEAQKGAAVPRLGGIADETSQAVRQQYEENPYPRRIGVNRKPAEPFPNILRTLFPHADLSGAPLQPRILIAGCGTGQQALSSATRYVDADVLAIDLSRRSLGVAISAAERWGLTNIRFAQADLLSLESLEERFDLIEAGGVLHHLADPEAGWRALRRLLVPWGWMRIALYSEAGRSGVVSAREIAAQLGFPVTPSGLRLARRVFLDLPESSKAHSVVWSPDFYSLSGFRDLVFHVSEQRFTLQRIAADLDELKLELVGFQHPRPEVMAWYREKWPEDLAQTDLARWAVIEQEHPEAFAGMYQFWCRALD